MVNALSVPFFMGKNKYLKYLNDLSRGRYFLWSEELDTRSSDNKMLPLLKISWVVGAVSSLFCHSTTDNISFNLNLAFWTALTSGPFAANLGTWDPPEHPQKNPPGPNSHLRHNLKIYLRLN